MGGIIFSPRQRRILVFFRKESGGFAATAKLTRLSEMSKDFINAVELNMNLNINKC
jgi:hypothetical protein